MSETFVSLLHRFGAQAQDRQLHIAENFSDISGGGWDIDFESGSVGFRESGRQVPVQAVGSEAGGSWMWAHELPGFPPHLARATPTLAEFGQKHEIRALQAAGFNLPEWEPGQLLSGMSCAVVAAGLLDAPGIFCCYDRAADRRLWVLLFDDTLREAPGVDPLTRIVVRFPKIYAMAGTHPHQGGITMVDWVHALDGYCRSHAVDGAMDGDAVVLTHEGRQARFTNRDGELSVEANL